MTHKILFASSRDGKDAVMSGKKNLKNKIPRDADLLTTLFYR